MEGLALALLGGGRPHGGRRGRPLPLGGPPAVGTSAREAPGRSPRWTLHQDGGRPVVPTPPRTPCPGGAPWRARARAEGRGGARSAPARRVPRGAPEAPPAP